MSGPFGVSMTIVSGQDFSGEIVVAAATLLSMNWLSIHLISTDDHIRPELLTALNRYGNKPGLYYQTQPSQFVERLTTMKHEIFSKDFFWLAMDKEGEIVASKILEENGQTPTKKVYQSVHKLNLMEPTITPPPLTPDEKSYMEWCASLYESLTPWQNIIKNIQSDLS